MLRAETVAVRGMPRVLDEPPPVCFLTEFGDSAVNFSLGFWMSDPALGIGNLRSDVMLALWDALKREGITIPYPQRDLHLKTPVEVVLARPRTDASV